MRPYSLATVDPRTTEAGGLQAYEPFDRLWPLLDRLPRKQHRLAQALIETPETFAFGSVREIAGKLEINGATIVRFARSLGYDGYQGLQAAVRRAYLQHAGLQAPRDEHALRGGVVAAVRAQHLSNLQQVHEQLLAADLDAIRDALTGARRILVCADGAAALVGLLLVRLLPHVGLRGELVPSAGVDRVIALRDAGPKDVLVAIGLWLTFRGTVQALRQAKEAGVRTIGITGSATSAIARYADHLIVAPAQGAAVSFSVIATAAAVEVLAATIVAASPDAAQSIEQSLHDRYLEDDLLEPFGER